MRDAQQRAAPRRARLLARPPLDVPAGDEQHGTAGASARSRTTATEMSRQPVGQRALAGQEERDRASPRRAPAGRSRPATARRPAKAQVRLGVGSPPRACARRPPAPARARVRCRRRCGASATLDLHHDREDHRPALRLLVQEARHAVLDLALEQRDLADVVARLLDRPAETRRIASSMIGSSSLPWTKPRVMISGRPTTLPVCLSTVTTIMNMPSFARARRSRRTMSPTSPTDRPSTNT